MDNLVETLYANHIFQVGEDGGEISTNNQDLFWTLAENIIFMICRSQTDIKTTIDFLTTRVK